MPAPPLIRTIQSGDDAAIAAVIRDVMPEFGADGPGFALHDAEVERMSAAYAEARAGYFVVENGSGQVVGGGGFAPLAGGPGDVAELRKMYFRRELRGLGVGSRLLDRILAAARTAGFARCYLETLSGMDAARRLYLAKGFSAIDGPLGGTGHFGCNTFMIRDL